MILTNEQTEFLGIAKASLNNTIIILTGEGGGGKTEVIARLVKHTGRHVLYLTPTHQAKTVLTQRLQDCGVREPDIQTLASFLGKRPDKNALPDEDDILGLRFEESDANLSIPANSIVVMDEASMISLADLDKLARRAWAGLLVICGDFKQVRPINDISVWGALMTHYGKNPNIKLVELRQNHRASSPQLVTFLNRVRDTGNFPVDNLPDDGSVTYVHDREAFNQMWTEALKNHGQEKVLRLAYTNAVVDAAAELGRKSLGYSGRFFDHGEVVRIGEPFEYLEWKEAANIAGRNASKAEIAAVLREHTVQNGDRVQLFNPFGVQPIVQTLTCDWTPGLTAPYVERSAKILTGIHKGVTFKLRLFEIGMGSKGSPVQKMLIAARKVAFAAANNNWHGFTDHEVERIKTTAGFMSSEPFGSKYWIGRLFWSLRSRVMVVSSALSMTVHKAQGSGADFVFVDSRNMGGPEASELKYTAASRTRKKLVVRL